MTDLLATARRLVEASPTQSDMKRAISTAYYAVFDELARNCADLLAGTGADRSDRAWNHAYRALEHGFAKRACGSLLQLGFPPEIVRFGAAFALLQDRRHEADYDPGSRFSREKVLEMITQAEIAIEDLARAAQKDRRAFAVHVLLKKRTA